MYHVEKIEVTSSSRKRLVVERKCESIPENVRVEFGDQGNEFDDTVFVLLI
jgi:hypothetical protein